MWVLLLFALLLAVGLASGASARRQSQVVTGLVVAVVAMQAVRGHLL